MLFVGDHVLAAAIEAVVESVSGSQQRVEWTEKTQIAWVVLGSYCRILFATSFERTKTIADQTACSQYRVLGRPRNLGKLGDVAGLSIIIVLGVNVQRLLQRLIRLVMRRQDVLQLFLLHLLQLQWLQHSDRLVLRRAQVVELRALGARDVD